VIGQNRIAGELGRHEIGIDRAGEQPGTGK
jgi:hypothetical protein